MNELEKASIIVKEVSAKNTKDGKAYFKVTTDKGIVYNIPQTLISKIEPGDTLKINYKIIEYMAQIAGISKQVKSKWVEAIGDIVNDAKLTPKDNNIAGSQDIDPVIYQVALQAIMLLVDAGYIDKKDINEQAVVSGIKRIAGELLK